MDKREEAIEAVSADMRSTVKEQCVSFTRITVWKMLLNLAGAGPTLEGIAPIDEIMVGLYRDFLYEVESRYFLVNKIYQMTKKGHLTKVPHRKGIVRLNVLPERSTRIKSTKQKLRRISA